MSPPTRDAQSARIEPDIRISQRRLTSRDLFGNTQEVLIEHAGCEYRLRITRQGKLILTK